MINGEQFLKALRDALNHLYEPRRLRQNPLATLLDVANRVDTPSRLQAILIEEIESFKPADTELISSQAWQTYGPLVYRYVEQLSQPEVADQLGLSVRHLRRKEHAALEALADKLWHKHCLNVQGFKMKPTEVTQSPPSTPTVQEELAWFKESYSQSKTDLNQTLPSILTLVAELAKRHNAKLDVRQPDTLPYIASDPVLVRQTLLNLFSAVLSKAQNVALTFDIVLRAQYVVFHIACQRDLPMAASSLANAMDEFDIVQQLTTLSDGSLDLTIDAEACQASLSLPIAEQLPVLVLDDNSDTLQLLQRYVADTRYHLITTQHPDQVQALIAKFAPRIIVLDVMLPGVDGWEILGYLKQNVQTMRIPIIVCTILPQQDLARLLGASDFIHKPITRQEFLAALDRQMAREGVAPH